MAIVSALPERMGAVAAGLLAAAEKLGLPASVVATSSDTPLGLGFIVPDEVATVYHRGDLQIDHKGQQSLVTTITDIGTAVFVESEAVTGNENVVEVTVEAAEEAAPEAVVVPPVKRSRGIAKPTTDGPEV